MLRTDLVRAERQIPDDQGSGVGSSDAANVILHLRQACRDGGLLSLYDGRRRIADEDHVDSGSIDETGEGGVVRRDHGDRSPVVAKASQIGNGDFSAFG